jgi:hypothetical protein
MDLTEVFMSGINLEKSIATLKKCYIGKVKGEHTLDASKIDDLSFKFAMFRLSLAFTNKELTEKEFFKKLRK